MHYKLHPERRDSFHNYSKQHWVKRKPLSHSTSGIPDRFIFRLKVFSLRGAMVRGGWSDQSSTSVPQRRYQDPPFAFTIAARGNPNVIVRGEKLITKIPVLNPAEAEIRLRQAAFFLERYGFPITNRQNLRNALIPTVNEELALAGDSKQRTILIDQCTREGRNKSKFYIARNERLTGS